MKQSHQESLIPALVRMDVHQLQLGMYIAELDKPWLETTFLYQGFMLERQEQLDALKDLCKYVFVDSLKARQWGVSQFTASTEIKTKSKKDPALNRVCYQDSVSVEEEFKKAAASYGSSLKGVVHMLRRVAEGTPVDLESAKRHVRSCVKSILRNPNALLWLTRIKHADQYTAEHCVNVGILAMSFGRFLGMEEAHIELLGLCGMLHDVGKMRIDQQVLNKAGKLTEEENRLIRMHPEFGYEILKQGPALPSEVLESAYSHHERIDGGGYPTGMNAEQLSLFTRMISVVDAYDAITSNRCYDSARSPDLALKSLYQGRGRQFDPELVNQFIQCVGIYPPGCLVELNTGEVGIVLAVDRDQRLLPKIVLVLDRNKRSIPQKVVDLSEREKLAATHVEVDHCYIKSALANGTHGIDLEEYTKANINIGASF